MNHMSQKRLHTRSPVGLFVLPEFAVRAVERLNLSAEDLLNPAVAVRVLSVNNLAQCIILNESFGGWFQGTDRLAIESALVACTSVAQNQCYCLETAWRLGERALPSVAGLSGINVNTQELISSAYALRTQESLKSELAQNYIDPNMVPVPEQKSLEGISFRILPNYGVAVVVAPRGPYTTEVRSMFLKALFKTLMQLYTIEELAGTMLFEQYLGCLSSGQ